MMAAKLLLCVLYQVLITSSLGAILPITGVPSTEVPIKPLSSSPIGSTLSSSPKVPSQASDLLLGYLKSREFGTDLSSPSHLTGITPSLSQKTPSKASDVLLKYFKSLSSETDLLSPIENSPKDGQSFASYSSMPSSSIPLPVTPSQSYERKPFTTISSPFSLPVVDTYKACTPKSYQPLYPEEKLPSTFNAYPPKSALYSLNTYSLSPVTSLPTVSLEVLKKNVDRLNSVSKFTSAACLPTVSPISSIETLPPVNIPYSLPYPLQYKPLSLPTVVTQSSTFTSKLQPINVPKYTPPLSFAIAPKPYSTSINDKSNTFKSITIPKAPVSAKTCLEASKNKNSGHCLKPGIANRQREVSVIKPVAPFPFNNPDFLSSIGSRDNRPSVPYISNHIVPLRPLLDDPFFTPSAFDYTMPDVCLNIDNNNNNDGSAKINLHSNLSKNPNATPNLVENRLPDIMAMPSLTDKLMPNIAENRISMTHNTPNILPNISTATTQVPFNYITVSPSLSFTTTAVDGSSSVNDILSKILCLYLHYLTSARRKPEKTVNILPLNPYSAPKRIHSPFRASLSSQLASPTLLPSTNIPTVLPLITSSTTMPLGISVYTDLTSYCSDFSSPSFTSYIPDVTAPKAQMTSTYLPLTSTCLPPKYFVDYSTPQPRPINLPSPILPSNIDYSSVIAEPQIVQVKSLDKKTKSIDRLLELIYLAELIKGRNSIDWDAIGMTLTLLNAI